MTWATTALPGILPLWRGATSVVPWPCMLVLAALLLLVRMLWRRSKLEGRHAAWEQLRLLELEAYCALELALPLHGEPRKLATQGKRVCRLVAEKSCYTGAALYLRSADGPMLCAGSCGMDDLSLAALDRWGERIVHEEETETGRDNERRGKDAVKSFSVVLGAPEQFDEVPGRDRHTATIIPLRMPRGRLVGALAVCLDGMAHLEAAQAPEAVRPLEALAGRLAGFVERGLLVQRLMEVERLAGAAQLVARVARQLDEPLTVVLETADRMLETAEGPRSQKDARRIATEARTMETILDGLRGFWRPPEEISQAAARTTEAQDQS